MPQEREGDYWVPEYSLLILLFPHNALELRAGQALSHTRWHNPRLLTQLSEPHLGWGLGPWSRHNSASQQPKRTSLGESFLVKWKEKGIVSQTDLGISPGSATS